MVLVDNGFPGVTFGLARTTQVNIYTVGSRCYVMPYPLLPLENNYSFLNVQYMEDSTCAGVSYDFIYNIYILLYASSNDVIVLQQEQNTP